MVLRYLEEGKRGGGNAEEEKRIGNTKHSKTAIGRVNKDGT